MSPPRGRAIVACVLSIAVSVLSGVASSTTSQAEVDENKASSSGPQLRLVFDDATYADGTATFVNHGSSRLAISMRTESDGELREGLGRIRPKQNKSVRTPRLDVSSTAARAVIRVVDRRTRDNLDPGTSGFTFGADFFLNADTETHESDSTDNGNNLVQRGLYNDQSQYKIQVDDAVPTCRIKGSDGVVQVSSSATVRSGRWYRARCTRSGDAVSLTITRWNDEGRAITIVTSVSGATGDLEPAASTLPLSIGGKLAADGNIAASADQFNGKVDNVVLSIG